jgi:hypothetical protein
VSNDDKRALVESAWLHLVKAIGDLAQGEFDAEAAELKLAGLPGFEWVTALAQHGG